VTPSSASAAPATSVTRGIPVPAEQISKTVNPEASQPYSGPTGAVRGTVRIKGDAPPVRPEAAKIPARCPGARDMYGRLFREGMLRSLADALVTVTEYDGFFGQRIDVKNRDGEAHMPNLLGGTMPAQIVAVPGGDPVQLYPVKVGRFGLVDTLNDFIFADVFVIKYPTFDVTGLDGKYEITGIPPGEVKVTAFLPAIMQTADKTIKIEANKTVDLDLEIAFDAKLHAPKPAPSASAARKGPPTPIIH
jgi:hypothetical protein